MSGVVQTITDVLMTVLSGVCAAIFTALFIELRRRRACTVHIWVQLQSYNELSGFMNCVRKCIEEKRNRG